MKTLSKCRIFSDKRKTMPPRGRGIFPSGAAVCEVILFCRRCAFAPFVRASCGAVSAGTLFRGGFGIGACLGIGCGRIWSIFEISHYLVAVGLLHTVNDRRIGDRIINARDLFAVFAVSHSPPNITSYDAGTRVVVAFPSESVAATALL